MGRALGRIPPSARLAAGAGFAALLEHRRAVVFGAVLAVTKVAQNDRHFLMGGTQQRQHFLVDLKRPLACHAADGGGDALQHIYAHRFAADAGVANRAVEFNGDGRIAVDRHAAFRRRRIAVAGVGRPQARPHGDGARLQHVAEIDIFGAKAQSKLAKGAALFVA